jgi:protocatechuate 3,4-dioxygenase, beta subunit
MGKLRSFEEHLDKYRGTNGNASKMAFDDEPFSFSSCIMLMDSRKSCNKTQKELVVRTCKVETLNHHTISKSIIFLLFAALFNMLTSCMAQSKDKTSASNKTEPNKIVGGGCDGCEIMFVGMPNMMDAVDTSAAWREAGQKLLLTGTVFNHDGKTSAPDVIIYYWQTDNNGFYSPKPGMDERAKRHGHIRGWVKTDSNGKYSIYTIIPGPYPNEDMPAHIHTSIKEPTIDNEYYIDEFVFDDDKLLTTEKRKALENRGGSGILKVLESGDLQIAEHNIILGLNIPNYPTVMKNEKK